MGRGRGMGTLTVMPLFSKIRSNLVRCCSVGTVFCDTGMGVGWRSARSIISPSPSMAVAARRAAATGTSLCGREVAFLGITVVCVTVCPLPTPEGWAAPPIGVGCRVLLINIHAQVSGLVPFTRTH